MKQYAQLGTLSHGTLRNEDLIPAFAEEIERLAKANDILPSYADVLAEAAGIQDYDSEEATEIVHVLMEMLNDFAPRYTTFSSHEGDGSDFGYWICWQCIEEAKQDGELPYGDDLP